MRCIPFFGFDKKPFKQRNRYEVIIKNGRQRKSGKSNGNKYSLQNKNKLGIR